MIGTQTQFETEFIDTTRRDDVDRRATRWIVFAGDRTDAYFKRTFDGMKLGGENLGHDYKTLAPSKGLLRRCQLTPMIVGHDDLNADTLGDDKSQVRSRQVFNPELRESYTIYYVECLPGDELSGLLAAHQGIFDFGIREVEVLRGIDPPKKQADGSISRSLGVDYQYTIFPEWDKYVSGEIEFFPTTSGLRNYLLNRAAEINDFDIQSVIDVMLESLDQFERWATEKLSDHSALVKAPPTETGRTFKWEPIHTQYFKVLELNREEFLMKKAETAPARESDAPSREEFNQMRDMFAQVMPAIGQLAQIAVTTQNGVKTEKKICSGLKADNSPCKAYVQGETDYCANHQPKIDVNA